MKKSALTIFICLSLTASFMAHADGLDVEQWTRYCKLSKENRERCESANMICEQYEKADCDQIKIAIMQRRSLDAILAKDKDKN